MNPNSQKGLALNPLPFDEFVADMLKVKPEPKQPKPNRAERLGQPETKTGAK